MDIRRFREAALKLELYARSIVNLYHNKTWCQTRIYHARYQFSKDFGLLSLLLEIDYFKLTESFSGRKCLTMATQQLAKAPEPLNLEDRTHRGEYWKQFRRDWTYVLRNSL